MTSKKNTPAPAARPARLSPEQALAGRYLQELTHRLRATGIIEDHETDDDLVTQTLEEALANTGAAGAATKAHFPVEIGLCATQMARAIADVPGLSEALEVAKPLVLVVHAPDADACDLIKRTIRQCILPPNTNFTAQFESTPSRPTAVFHVDDGTETGRSWRKNSANELRLAIRRGQCAICVTTSPRNLPDVVRTHALATLRLPRPDAWSLRTLAQFRFGVRATVVLDEAVARSVDPLGLLIAWRDVRTADEAMQVLADAARMRTRLAAKGPNLSELEGYGEAKTWGMELAADLQAMCAGKLTWADIDHKGLLLSGPPGTGKTTFAQALANEAGVPLIATSVADWTRAEHLGITQEKMKKAFSDAMARAPSILFIDELDGIANRGTLEGHNAEYWTHVINALLEHLAGVEDREGVVVLGASNHPHKIDAAVLRSGRLDRHIEIPLPDLPALEQILRYHLRGDLEGVDLRGLVTSLIGHSGADVEALVRRARGKARRSGRPMSKDDLVAVCRDGGQFRDPALLRRIAVHEAGHVLAARKLGAKVTCVSMTTSGGIAVIDMDLDGRATFAQIENMIVIGLAGRAAEEVVFGPGERSAGGENDLEKATALALTMETRLGAGVLGPLHLGGANLSSLLMMPEIRHAVANRLIDAQEKAIRLIRADLAAHASLVDAMLVDGYLGSDAIDDVIARARRPKPLRRQARLRTGGGHVA